MTRKNDGAPAPVAASVVALGMADFAHRRAEEQTAPRTQLEALTGVALQPLAAAGRIVLDAADALAVVVLAGPAAAMVLAERARAAAGELPLRVGIDYGPLRGVEDAALGTCVEGDGLDGALELAARAEPGAVLASPRYRAALEAATASGGAAREQRRWRMTLFAAAASVLVALGAGAHALRPPPAPPVKPALLQFEIKQRGEVYVDGKMRGPTPPLTQIEVAPGAHTLEVRNGAFAPLQLEVNLAAAEQITIRHEFAAPKPPPSPPHKKPKREPRKEARKEIRSEPRKEETKEEVNWGRNIRSDFDNMKRKLGF
ncbi:MAG: PEGA domain-containing protein [Burkholderiales bacterium]